MFFFLSLHSKPPTLKKFLFSTKILLREMLLWEFYSIKLGITVIDCKACGFTAFSYFDNVVWRFFWRKSYIINNSLNKIAYGWDHKNKCIYLFLIKQLLSNNIKIFQRKLLKYSILFLSNYKFRLTEAPCVICLQTC